MPKFPAVAEEADVLDGEQFGMVFLGARHFGVLTGAHGKEKGTHSELAAGLVKGGVMDGKECAQDARSEGLLRLLGGVLVGVPFQLAL